MIDALPTPPVSTSPTTFASDMDIFLAALPTFRSQANALAATMDAVAGGGAVSLPYTFSSTTTDADPGAGYLRLDNATQNASTTIRADLSGSDASDLTGVLALLDDSTSVNKGYLKLQHATDATKWLVFAVVSVASPSGYRNITAICAASSATNPFTNGDSLLFDFTPTGDKGDKGDTGATGLTYGPGGRTITGSVTLTASSSVITNAAIFVTPAGPGLYASLPVATGLTAGVPHLSLYNAGDYDYGVKDSAGTVLGWVRPRTGAVIGLADASTGAGTWTPMGLEKTGVTASYSNPTLTATGTYTPQIITVDADRIAFLFGGATCYVVVYNKTTQTWGTATAVRASIQNGTYTGILAATDKLLVCTCDATTGMETVTVSLSGTTPTVNTGTKASTTLAGNISASGLGFGRIIAVGSSWAVSYGRDTTTCGIRAITVSGTTPTVGAEAAVSSSLAGFANLYASGSVLRAVLKYSNTSLTCQPYTVSGSSLSAGTAATVTTESGSPFRAFLNGNGNIVANYMNSNHSATIFKLTGTVEAASTAVLSSTGPSVNITNTDYAVISAGKTVYISYGGTSTWYSNILTDTAGTASVGTEISGLMAATVSYLAKLGVSGNTVRFAVTAGTTQGGQITLDCSGTSPVLSAANFCPLSGLQYPATASNRYGELYPSQMNVGTSSHIVSGGAYEFDTIATPIFFKRTPSILLAANPANYGVRFSDSEIWATSPLNNSTTGQIFQRVEAAA